MEDLNMEPIKVRVCVGTNCCFAGGESLIEMLENDAGLADFVELEEVGCMDKTCDGGRQSPVVEICGLRFTRATPEVVMEEIERLAVARIADLPKAREVPNA
ncbi:MAG TPA: hypothetical protein VN445_09160 [Rectinemataceae bacterium]|nr:hypothetical protein [Rectinemataceae bacterium]